jgi:hypothetical protein
MQILCHSNGGARLVVAAGRIFWIFPSAMLYGAFDCIIKDVSYALMMHRALLVQGTDGWS